MRNLYLLIVCLIFNSQHAVHAQESGLPSKQTNTEKPSERGIFNTLKSKRKKLKQQNEDLAKQSAELDATLAAERQEKTNLASKLENEQETKAFLSQSLEKQTKAFASLSEHQARTELMLASERILSDSLRFASEMAKFKLNEQETKLLQHQAELSAIKAEEKLLRTKTALFVILAICGALAAFAFYHRMRSVSRYSKLLEEKNLEIKAEKQRAENLLFNILPVQIAHELQRNGCVIAKEFDEVTVMFADFVNFTRIAELRSPQELVEDLNQCFSAFDQIIGRHQLEKIKTIGDAYMVAGGLPHPSPQHAENMVLAAQEMQAFLYTWNQERLKKQLPEFHARIGIHTGTVVAGVVGERKFAFDIWGDCVNIAARMEHASEGDRINVSAATRKLLPPQFRLSRRGQVKTKNKGEMEMFYVET